MTYLITAIVLIVVVYGIVKAASGDRYAHMTEEEFEESKTVIGGLAYPAWKEGVVFHPDA